MRTFGNRVLRFAGSAVLLGGLACGDLVGTAELPAGTQGPNTYNTPAGALAVANGAKGVLGGAFLAGTFDAWSLTDELTSRGLGSGPLSVGGMGDALDERVLAEDSRSNYSATYYAFLQKTRATTIQATGLLRAYMPNGSPALIGEMLALQGYAEVMLADMFCSGVPLSTLDFQGDFTYKPSSTTDDVYAHALALFDSALAISSDSPSVVNLASVGKARVLLRQGQYAEAAAVVMGVPTSFQYQVPVQWPAQSFQSANVSSNEGGNGIPFYTTSGTLVTSNDPRSWVVPASPATNNFSVPQFVPAKYPSGSSTPVVLASGVEARLIEAEADLNSGGTQWLSMLNALRTDGAVANTYTRTCTGGISPCPAGVIDTTWGAGTGLYLIPESVQADNQPACASSGPCTDTVWYKGLRPLADPALGTVPTGKTAFDVRLDLVMQERAYWLFLTGHRQGDLRRLVHTYNRPQDTVYPSGPYYGGFGAYGDDVDVPIPSTEQPNPLFHGCLGRGA